MTAEIFALVMTKLTENPRLRDLSLVRGLYLISKRVSFLLLSKSKMAGAQIQILLKWPLSDYVK